jgi:hypothetical protein
MKSLIKILIIIWLGLSLTQLSFPYDDGDGQLWNTVSIEGKLSQRWKIKLEEEFRFGDSMEALYYHHTDLGLSYKLTNWFYLGLNFRQIYEKKKEAWKKESRPHLNLTYKFALGNFKFKNRGRLEYRIKEDKRYFRFRNKFTINLLPIGKNKIKLYIADEVFYDFDKDRLNRNRLCAGLKLKLLEELNLDTFYLWQTTEKKGNWIDYNVMGVKINFKF